ncbi:MAG: DNA alkylation repair protein [Bacteroidales bacterium]|nr:DNA alkylation repair protein [Bacteroidales bacterium]
MAMQSYEERFVRKQFFAYRNGMLAESMRNAGNVHSMIFGLNLHQIVEIAAGVTQDAALAESLWSDTKCREARLFAPMVMPREALAENDAVRWCDSVADYEEADVLCHRLLRYEPYAQDLVETYRTSGDGLKRYLAYRLMLNLLSMGRYTTEEQAESLAKAEMADAAPALKSVLLSIIDLIDFRRESK